MRHLQKLGGGLPLMVNQPSAASSFTDHGIQVSSFIGRSLSELQRSSEAEIPTRSGRSNILWAFSIVLQPVSFRSILTSLLHCFAVVSQKDSSISATRYFATIEENASEPDHGIARTYGRKRKKSVLTGASEKSPYLRARSLVAIET